MSLSLRKILGLLLGLGLIVSTMHALEGGFTAALSPEKQAEAGLTTLTGDERAYLNRLVAAESAPGREIYSALNTSFVRRQTSEDRHQAGLDRLSPEQLDRLSAYVATALAPRPKPKERPRIKDSEVLTTKPPPEIHGAITFGLGWGGGGTSRYGALQLEYYDPEHGLSLGIGLESYSGPGRYGYYPYHGYSGFIGPAAGNFPASGRPVWTNDFDRDRYGITPRSSIRSYFEPALTPTAK